MEENRRLTKEIEEEANRKAKQMVRETDGIDEEALGYCHAFWQAKKEILLRDYGINWKTPAEKYPHVLFD